MEDKILKACIALLTIGDVIYFINSTGVQSDRNVDKLVKIYNDFIITVFKSYREGEYIIYKIPKDDLYLLNNKITYTNDTNKHLVVKVNDKLLNFMLSGDFSLVKN